MSEPVVDLLTRPGCHLCEDARQVVALVCAEFSLSFTEINVDEHPELARRHATEVPVLCIDGQAKDFWRINPNRMRKLIAAKLG